MSSFTDDLDAFAERLARDGYPTALIERAAERMQDMEGVIIDLSADLLKRDKVFRELRDEIIPNWSKREAIWVIDDVLENEE